MLEKKVIICFMNIEMINKFFIYRPKKVLACPHAARDVGLVIRCMTLRKKFFHTLILTLISLFTTTVFAFNPYSTDELDQLEKEFVQQINLSDQVERNPLAIQYINHIGRELAQSGHMQAPYFFLVKSNEINAFAGPGGHIGINSALILTSSNESELAAVMAHEMAHVRLHHLYRMIQHEKQMRIPMLATLLASIALGVIDPTLASGAVMASMTGFAQDSINFTRSNEKEADRIGIGMLMNAGFDPKSMISFFKKMQENSRYYYSVNVPAILRTHPLDEDRIAEAENRSANYPKKQYADHIDYHLFKELIRNAVHKNPKEQLDFYRSQCFKVNSPDACAYGKVLTLLNMDSYSQSKAILQPLLTKEPENLFYQFAMADSEIGLKDYPAALSRLHNLQNNYPDSYAVLMNYGDGLMAAGKPALATSVLLKGFRQYKHDLTLCEALAQSQSQSNQKAYAYFTESQCYLIQGRRFDALRQLKQARMIAKNDKYLLARIDAMMDDIKRE